MSVKTFTPNPKYMTKQRIAFGLIALAILFFGLLLAIPISFDSDNGVVTGMIFAGVFGGIAVLFWALAALLVIPYYNSLRYEIHEDEVIVHVGVVTKSVKHVPYRTVTNIVVNRGILDRFFGLGTLKIQTAGMSGQTGAEESLVGLSNVQEVYDLVAAELRRFRAGMTPTGADVDPSQQTAVAAPAGELTAILAEIKAIRAAIEKSKPVNPH